MLGRVKWFNPKIGYGFIIRDDTQGDVFVHYRSVSTDSFDGIPLLQQGDRVKFDVAMNHLKQKTYAFNVKVIDDEEASPR